VFAARWRGLPALLLALITGSALAQVWPTKPIRWIVPFPPGGATDLASRPVAERLTQVFGQVVVVENRVGAGGNIGAESVARSAADGYTVLATVDSIAAAPHLHPRLGFDPLKDFVPVTQLSRQPLVLAVHPLLRVDSVAEFVAIAKTKPGLAYATSGAGTQQHIAAEWFASLAGIRLTHVPYTGGGQAITDFIAGQVPVAFLGSSPLIPHYKSGKIRLLAQTTRTRAPALPEVPTFEEGGFKGLIVEQWVGVLLPAGAPKEIVARPTSRSSKRSPIPRSGNATHRLESNRSATRRTSSGR
jgi:tripartite-type tricarboxylate transporter receptor subunit TctC